MLTEERQKKIYAYTTETYKKKNWYKIGETYQEVDDRIDQQDGTSNPEKDTDRHKWYVPDHISDKDVHRLIESWGCKPTRIDKSREWYVTDIETVEKAINQLMYGIARPNSFEPREEQQECVKKAVQYFIGGGIEFLINAKMRFGKTFASYLIAKDLGAKDILVLTYKPAVKAGWEEDLNTHVYFEGWNYSHNEGIQSMDPNAKVNVVFASFQDINNHKSKDKWQGIIDHEFDLIIIDEMHYGSDTERAKLTLADFKTKHTLYVSGTPLDAIISGRFDEYNTYTWSYADEQRKRREEKENNWATEIYRPLPEMEIHTFEVSNEAKKQVSLYNEDEQFTMTKMFGSDDGKTFNDEASVKLFLDQVFGRNVRKDKSPIKTYASDHMLWTMPPNVKSVNAMCSLLEKMVGDEYHVINVAGNNITSLKKVKDKIRFFDKTITVTAGRFNTGVTVPEWDSVYMLGDGKAPETYFQTIFRVQSPNKKTGKEKCYVFDFNPERVLELVYTYAELTALTNQTTNNAVRDFLEFCPIIDHTDNALKQISTEDIVSFITENGNDIDRFTSSYNFMRDSAGDFMDLLALDGGVTAAKDDKLVNSNNMTKGKNYITTSLTIPKTPANKKLVDEIIEKAKLITAKIPEYVLLVDPVKDINSLLNTNTKFFENHFEIPLEMFKKMVYSNFVNKERMNRLIGGLQYE